MCVKQDKKEKLPCLIFLLSFVSATMKSGAGGELSHRLGIKCGYRQSYTPTRLGSQYCGPKNLQALMGFFFSLLAAPTNKICGRPPTSKNGTDARWGLESLLAVSSGCAGRVWLK
jgi:hypothetical protein